MNEEENNIVYESLLKILQDQGLEWVSEQVEEQVRLGKTIDKEVETLKEPRRSSQMSMFVSEYEHRYTRGPKAKFPVRVKYEPGERLNLLISAIKEAVVNTSEMEIHLFKSLDEEETYSSIDFAPEEGGEIISITRKSAHERHQNCMRLLELLMTLGGEINDE